MFTSSPPTLLLIPTAKERDLLLLHPALQSKLEPGAIAVELCGFGPIAAAAETAHRLGSGNFHRVILAGIAGTYTTSLPIGSAWLFREVRSWGIGAGSGEAFQPSTEFGFSQLPTRNSSTSTQPHDALDALRLTVPRPESELPIAELLLTCCASAGTPQDVLQRLKFHPQAGAEDMEGFGVGVACLSHFGQMQPLPLTIIRGISNQAGVRDKQAWQIKPALDAVAELLCQLL